MPETADMPMTPSRQNECFLRMRTACSMSRGSRPQQRLQVLYRTDHAACLPFERGLAPAYQPGLVGFDAHEYPIAHPGVNNQRVDVSDLHGLLLLGAF